MIITLANVLEAAQRDDYTGICIACGEERGMCEPDAREYECHECGAMKVYGAEELLVSMLPG